MPADDPWPGWEALRPTRSNLSPPVPLRGFELAHDPLGFTWPQEAVSDCCRDPVASLGVNDDVGSTRVVRRALQRAEHEVEALRGEVRVLKEEKQRVDCETARERVARNEERRRREAFEAELCGVLGWQSVVGWKERLALLSDENEALRMEIDRLTVVGGEIRRWVGLPRDADGGAVVRTVKHLSSAQTELTALESLLEERDRDTVHLKSTLAELHAQAQELASSTVELAADPVFRPEADLLLGAPAGCWAQSGGGDDIFAGARAALRSVRAALPQLAGCLRMRDAFAAIHSAVRPFEGRFAPCPQPPSPDPVQQCVADVRGLAAEAAQMAAILESDPHTSIAQLSRTCEALQHDVAGLTTALATAEATVSQQYATIENLEKSVRTFAEAETACLAGEKRWKAQAIDLVNRQSELLEELRGVRCELADTRVAEKNSAAACSQMREELEEGARCTGRLRSELEEMEAALAAVGHEKARLEQSARVSELKANATERRELDSASEVSTLKRTAKDHEAETDRRVGTAEGKRRALITHLSGLLGRLEPLPGSRGSGAQTCWWKKEEASESLEARIEKLESGSDAGDSDAEADAVVKALTGVAEHREELLAAASAASGSSRSDAAPEPKRQPGRRTEPDKKPASLNAGKKPAARAEHDGKPHSHHHHHQRTPPAASQPPQQQQQQQQQKQDLGLVHALARILSIPDHPSDPGPGPAAHRSAAPSLGRRIVDAAEDLVREEKALRTALSAVSSEKQRIETELSLQAEQLATEVYHQRLEREALLDHLKAAPVAERALLNKGEDAVKECSEVWSIAIDLAAQVSPGAWDGWVSEREIELGVGGRESALAWETVFKTCTCTTELLLDVCETLRQRHDRGSSKDSGSRTPPSRKESFELVHASNTLITPQHPPAAALNFSATHLQLPRIPSVPSIDPSAFPPPSPIIQITQDTLTSFAHPHTQELLSILISASPAPEQAETDSPFPSEHATLLTAANRIADDHASMKACLREVLRALRPPYIFTADEMPTPPATIADLNAAVRDALWREGGPQTQPGTDPAQWTHAAEKLRDAVLEAAAAAGAPAPGPSVPLETEADALSALWRVVEVDVPRLADGLREKVAPAEWTCVAETLRDAVFSLGEKAALARSLPAPGSWAPLATETDALAALRRLCEVDVPRLSADIDTVLAAENPHAPEDVGKTAWYLPDETHDARSSSDTADPRTTPDAGKEAFTRSASDLLHAWAAAGGGETDPPGDLPSQIRAVLAQNQVLAAEVHRLRAGREPSPSEAGDEGDERTRALARRVEALVGRVDGLVEQNGGLAEELERMRAKAAAAPPPPRPGKPGPKPAPAAPKPEADLESHTSASTAESQSAYCRGLEEEKAALSGRVNVLSAQVEVLAGENRQLLRAAAERRPGPESGASSSDDDEVRALGKENDELRSLVQKLESQVAKTAEKKRGPHGSAPSSESSGATAGSGANRVRALSKENAELRDLVQNLTAQQVQRSEEDAAGKKPAPQRHASSASSSASIGEGGAAPAQRVRALSKENAELRDLVQSLTVQVQRYSAAEDAGKKPAPQRHASSASSSAASVGESGAPAQRVRALGKENAELRSLVQQLEAQVAKAGEEKVEPQRHASSASSSASAGKAAAPGAKQARARKKENDELRSLARRLEAQVHEGSQLLALEAEKAAVLHTKRDNLSRRVDELTAEVEDLSKKNQEMKRPTSAGSRVKAKRKPSAGRDTASHTSSSSTEYSLGKDREPAQLQTGLKALVEQLTQRNQTLSEEVLFLTEQVEALATENQDLISKQEAGGERDEGVQSNEALSEQARVQTERAATESQVLTAKQEDDAQISHSLSEQIRALSGQVEALTAENQSLTSEKEDGERDYAQSNEALSEQVQALVEHVDALTAENRDLVSKQDETRGARDDPQSDHALREQVRILTVQVEALTAENQRLSDVGHHRGTERAKQEAKLPEQAGTTGRESLATLDAERLSRGSEPSQPEGTKPRASPLDDTPSEGESLVTAHGPDAFAAETGRRSQLRQEQESDALSADGSIASAQGAERGERLPRLDDRVRFLTSQVEALTAKTEHLSRENAVLRGSRPKEDTSATRVHETNALVDRVQFLASQVEGLTAETERLSKENDILRSEMRPAAARPLEEASSAGSLMSHRPARRDSPVKGALAGRVEFLTAQVAAFAAENERLAEDNELLRGGRHNEAPSADASLMSHGPAQGVSREKNALLDRVEFLTAQVAAFAAENERLAKDNEVLRGGRQDETPSADASLMSHEPAKSVSREKNALLDRVEFLTAQVAAFAAETERLAKDNESLRGGGQDEAPSADASLMSHEPTKSVSRGKHALLDRVQFLTAQVEAFAAENARLTRELNYPPGVPQASGIPLQTQSSGTESRELEPMASLVTPGYVDPPSSPYAVNRGFSRYLTSEATGLTSGSTAGLEALLEENRWLVEEVEKLRIKAPAVPAGAMARGASGEEAATAEARVAALEAEKVDLHAELRRLRSLETADASGVQLARAEARVAALEAEKEDLDTELNRLRSIEVELAKSEARVEALEAEKGDLFEELDRLRAIEGDGSVRMEVRPSQVEVLLDENRRLNEEMLYQVHAFPPDEEFVKGFLNDLRGILRGGEPQPEAADGDRDVRQEAEALLVEASSVASQNEILLEEVRLLRTDRQQAGATDDLPGASCKLSTLFARRVHNLFLSNDRHTTELEDPDLDFDTLLDNIAGLISQNEALAEDKERYSLFTNLVREILAGAHQPPDFEEPTTDFDSLLDHLRRLTDDTKKSNIIAETVRNLLPAEDEDTAVDFELLLERVKGLLVGGDDVLVGRERRRSLSVSGKDAVLFVRRIRDLLQGDCSRTSAADLSGAGAAPEGDMDALLDEVAVLVSQHEALTDEVRLLKNDRDEYFSNSQRLGGPHVEADDDLAAKFAERVGRLFPSPSAQAQPRDQAHFTSLYRHIEHLLRRCEAPEDAKLGSTEPLGGTPDPLALFVRKVGVLLSPEKHSPGGVLAAPSESDLESLYRAVERLLHRCEASEDAKLGSTEPLGGAPDPLSLFVRKLGVLLSPEKHSPGGVLAAPSEPELESLYRAVERLLRRCEASEDAKLGSTEPACGAPNPAALFVEKVGLLLRPEEHRPDDPPAASSEPQLESLYQTVERLARRSEALAQFTRKMGVLFSPQDGSRSAAVEDGENGDCEALCQAVEQRVHHCESLVQFAYKLHLIFSENGSPDAATTGDCESLYQVIEQRVHHCESLVQFANRLNLLFSDESLPDAAAASDCEALYERVERLARRCETGEVGMPRRGSGPAPGRRGKGPGESDDDGRRADGSSEGWVSDNNPARSEGSSNLASEDGQRADPAGNPPPASAAAKRRRPAKPAPKPAHAKAPAARGPPAAPARARTEAARRPAAELAETARFPPPPGIEGWCAGASREARKQVLRLYSILGADAGADLDFVVDTVAGLAQYSEEAGLRHREADAQRQLLDLHMGEIARFVSLPPDLEAPPGTPAFYSACVDAVRACTAPRSPTDQVPTAQAATAAPPACVSLCSHLAGFLHEFCSRASEYTADRSSTADGGRGEAPAHDPGHVLSRLAGHLAAEMDGAPVGAAGWPSPLGSAPDDGLDGLGVSDAPDHVLSGRGLWCCGWWAERCGATAIDTLEVLLDALRLADQRAMQMDYKGVSLAGSTSELNPDLGSPSRVRFASACGHSEVVMRSAVPGIAVKLGLKSPDVLYACFTAPTMPLDSLELRWKREMRRHLDRALSPAALRTRSVSEISHDLELPTVLAETANDPWLKDLFFEWWLCGLPSLQETDAFTQVSLDEVESI